MKKLLLTALVALSAALLVGCGTTGKFVYPANMSTLVKFGSAPVVDKQVAVLPFDDYRGDENSCMFGMYVIPLMPFGWGNYERPDAAQVFLSVPKYDTTPTEDLAKATAVSFRHSKLFRNVFFTMGGEQEKADFLLHGRIKEMSYKGKIFTYGLSIYGPLFWLFGAPAGMSENKLSIELSMTDKSGKNIWDWSMTAEDSIVQWMYYRMGHDVRMYSYLYQDGMNRALENLAQKMKEQPELFK